jgi:hypothetical protein
LAFHTPLLEGTSRACCKLSSGQDTACMGVVTPWALRLLPAVIQRRSSSPLDIVTTLSGNSSHPLCREEATTDSSELSGLNGLHLQHDATVHLVSEKVGRRRLSLLLG